MEITLGLEEELMLIDRESGAVLTNPAQSIFDRADVSSSPHRVVREFLRSQMETNSVVCHSLDELRTSLDATRSACSQAADKEGAAIIASSTHPYARWEEQQVTDKERYRNAEIELQDAVRRFFIGGMHLHAGFANADIRVRTMDAIVGDLPLLLALSASSPFNAGRITGLKSFRHIAMNALPRTGIAPPMRSWQDFETIAERYRTMGTIADASELRWDIRPSTYFPTIELRICDICPLREDALAIAALYACLIRHCARAIEAGDEPERASPELTEERKWLAQRYGSFAQMPTGNGSERVGVEEILEDFETRMAQDIVALGAGSYFKRAKEIAREGTSADRQEDTYREAILDGASEQEALKAVVEQIRAETEGELPRTRHPG